MKLTKEDIDKVRDIEGFPIAKDEDIIALSNPPYYTACPNPFIEDFIKKHGKPYDEETDDYIVEPLADDVEEDKHDLIYNIHGYHTKVPPKAIKKYIEHYTKPGDIVLDCFCGSGMTGIAAQMCEDKNRQLNVTSRKAILCDLSSYATFISSNYNNPNDYKILKEIEDNISEISKQFNHYYTTIHNSNGIQYDINGSPIKGTINYVVWSDVFYCPNCGNEMIYYSTAIDEKTKKSLKKFNCKSCNMELTKTNIILKRETQIDKSTGEIISFSRKVPVLINYSVNKKRFFKEPDEEDIKKIEQIQIKQWFPKDKLPVGYNTEQPKRSHGMENVNSFYTKRTLLLLSEFYNLFKSDNKKLFLFTSALPKLTLLNRYMPEHGSRALVGPMVGTYYVPSLSVENNVIHQMEFQFKKLKNLTYTKGHVLVSTQSATDLKNIPDNSIDYIFIDPPFGANIMYSELNFMPESWLNIKTENNSEAIVNNVQSKGVNEYKELMMQCFKEIYKKLKPNRWVTIEFHNSKNIIWNAIQESLTISGFVIADVRTLNKEKKTVMQYKSSNTVDQDLVISAYKPKESFNREFISHAGSEKTAWDFTRQHLEKLPIVVIKGDNIQIIVERQAFLLFDRMVAYHIMKGLPVPLDAADFYQGLDEKFLKRDGMYFLHDQVNEYDTARITNEVENIQMALFVTDEKTAIAWLYQQLNSPQTYGELQPKFMQEIRSIEKYEKLPELSVLLEDNFIQNEQGQWYIPDVTKSADVAKLREKRLIKEFEEYLNSTGKLKLFRTEAIRAGFAKLWKEKNYELIVKTADRLPESVIQEDDKLLIYYDVSLGRI